MTLPYDIARCGGVQTEGHWREGCETCLRRTSPGRPEWQAYMEPPAILAFFCPWLIEPGESFNVPNPPDLEG